MDLWFRGTLGDVYGDEVLGADARLATYFPAAGLRSLLAEHRTGSARHGARLWTLLMMERWLRDLRSDRPLTAPTAGVLRG